MVVVTGSNSLDLSRSVDGLGLLGREGGDSLAGYWRLDLYLYGGNPRKWSPATETESSIFGVRFTARLAYRH